MYEALIAVCICLALALGAVFFLSLRLADANKQAFTFATKCLEHTCAFNEDQRIYMQTMRAIEAQPPEIPPAPPESFRPRPPHEPETVTAPIPFEG